MRYLELGRVFDYVAVLDTEEMQWCYIDNECTADNEYVYDSLAGADFVVSPYTYHWIGMVRYIESSAKDNKFGMTPVIEIKLHSCDSTDVYNDHLKFISDKDFERAIEYLPNLVPYILTYGEDLLFISIINSIISETDLYEDDVHRWRTLVLKTPA